jgi:glutathione-regulated potassium-efflux system protein KefB
MQILRDRGDFASRHGSTTFSVLLMQDLAIVPLLAAVPILSDTGPHPAEIPYWKQLAIVVGMFGLIGALGRYLMPVVLERLARQGNREAFLLVVMLAVFLSAYATHKAGLSMALGAFLMGMLLSESHYNLQIQAYIEPYKGLLISIFFVAIGMSIDVGVIAQHPATFAQHAIAIIVIKVVVMFLLGLVFGLPRDVNARVSSLLAQGGEFGFVLLGSARVLKVIDQETFVLTIGIISVSMLTTPLLVRLGDAVARRFEEQQRDEDSIYHADKGEIRAKVIIGGYGRVGHIVATLLHSSGVPFIAFDRQPACVAKGKADGYPVYFGDISDPDLLAAVRVEQASLVVLTVDDVETAIRAASHIGTAYPHVPVIARARDLEVSGRLLEAGATVAHPELVESSLHLAANALEMVGVPEDNVDLLLQGIRDRSYALVRRAGDVGPQV